jgi:hypothetical protein
VTGVAITLTDPNSDGDGFTDYEELHLTGTSPTDPQDGARLLEETRTAVVAHWTAIRADPPVFTNLPGSQADLNDLQTALQALATNFHIGGPSRP